MIFDLISRWPYVFSLVLFLVLGIGSLVALVAIAAIVTIQWRKHRQNELEYSLKQEMLERGMSAEDIERVLRAGRDRADRPQRPFPWMARGWCCW